MSNDHRRPRGYRGFFFEPITPTHRPRLRTPTGPVSPEARALVDSEGYSFVDFPRGESPTERRQLPPRSEYVDSEGYSYIDPNLIRRTPGLARRVIRPTGYATDEEVCPLCTVQRIHGLLARPEDSYIRYS